MPTMTGWNSKAIWQPQLQPPTSSLDFAKTSSSLKAQFYDPQNLEDVSCTSWTVSGTAASLAMNK